MPKRKKNNAIECPVCEGGGSIFFIPKGKPELGKKECPICQGKGMLTMDKPAVQPEPKTGTV